MGPLSVNPMGGLISGSPLLYTVLQIMSGRQTVTMVYYLYGNNAINIAATAVILLYTTDKNRYFSPIVFTTMCYHLKNRDL